MALSLAGWGSVERQAFEAAGKLAGAVAALRGGRTEEARKAIEQERKEQKKAVEQAELKEMKGVTAKMKAFFNWQNLKNVFFKYWWIFLIAGVFVGFLILRKPIMRLFNIKRRSRPRSRSRSRSKSRTRTTRRRTTTKRKSKSKGKKRGGSLTVHGRRFSSMSAKMRYLRSLRKK